MEINFNRPIASVEPGYLVIEHPIKEEKIPDLRAALMQRQGLIIESEEQAKTVQNLLDDERLKDEFVIIGYLKRALAVWGGMGRDRV